MLRSYLSLCYVAFACTFTDNALRLILIIVLSFMAFDSVADPVEAQGLADYYRSLIGFFYALPMIFFSILAGQLADRFSKSRIVRTTRILEIFFWVACILLYLLTGTFSVLIVLLFLLGMRMTFFGPPSSGLMGEILPEENITRGTGGFELISTFGAILGTMIAGYAIDAFSNDPTWPVIALGVFAVSGLVASLMISSVPAASPDRLVQLVPWSTFKETLKTMWDNKGVRLSTMGVVFWWGLASLAMVVSMKYSMDSIDGAGAETSRLFIYIAVSMLLSAVFISRYATRHLELGFVPIGGIGMGLCFVLCGILPVSELSAAVTLFGAGFFAGWFMIPLKSFVIRKSERESRGAILGVLNFFQYCAIFSSSSFIYYILTAIIGLSAPQVFLIMGLSIIVVSVWIVFAVPEIVIRFLLYSSASIFFKRRVSGLENIPKEGGALLVCNHTSYVDGLMVVASNDREIRPIMYDEMYQKPEVRLMADLVNPITINDRMGPRELIRTLKNVTEIINNGELVMIFAEGQISRVGNLLTFRKGLERIMKDTDAPIIPVAIDGLRNNFFGISYRRKFVMIPKRLWAPVRIVFGKPMPSSSAAPEVHQGVQNLLTKCWAGRRSEHTLVHRYAFSMARRHPFEKAFFDHNTLDGISRLKFAVGSIVFARLLHREWKDSERIGICLPPSIGSAVINHAALLSGKVTVNLNYTASTEVIEKTCENAEVTTIITSKEFLEKAKVQLPGKLIYAEDLKEKVTDSLRKSALKEFLTTSTKRLEKKYGNGQPRKLSDTATIIYSSGSTGIPKGVCLSHWNITANCRQVIEVLPLGKDDTILGILPFFHSFGTMATLFLPHIGRIRASYLPNPLDPVAIGNAAREHNVTFLVATPTFLNSFTRRIEERDFGSIKYVIAGAEKLRPQVADAFESKFGIKILEGYGCTELSPVVAMCTPHFRSPGVFQKTNQRGSIGLPLPGISVRIVDPATEEPLDFGQEGLLLVKGPNVMKGYLKQEAKTAEVLRNGWYTTGDIARIDENGFIYITDRLSRFSKIGGEMVPHLKVEQALQETIPDADQPFFVVTGVPDDKKGEKLVILTILETAKAKESLEKVASRKEIPNLWIPKANDIYRIDEIPMLGSGKMDLKQLGQLAQELSS